MRKLKRITIPISCVISLDQFLKQMKPSYDFILISEAYKLAVNAHKGQDRKYEDNPYVVHPIRIALYLKYQGQDLVIAALLHDVLEKSETSYDQIYNQFGETVAKLVDGVSKIDGRTMQEALEHVVEKYPQVISLRIADRIDNMMYKYAHLPEERVEQYQKENRIIIAMAKEHETKFGLDDLLTLIKEKY